MRAYWYFAIGAVGGEGLKRIVIVMGWRDLFFFLLSFFFKPSFYITYMLSCSEIEVEYVSVVGFLGMSD